MVLEIELLPEFGEPTWYRRENDEEQSFERDPKPQEKQYEPRGTERPYHHRRLGLRDD